jgi:hypothetical protein
MFNSSLRVFKEVSKPEIATASFWSETAASSTIFFDNEAIC